MATALGSLAIGPLSGQTPAERRHAMINELADRAGTAVFVAQITTGGLGLNIQAASVAVIGEPQWKSSIEEQAIARLHRMGQVEQVNAYRLLITDSGDVYVEAIAKKKVKSSMTMPTPASLPNWHRLSEGLNVSRFLR